MSGIQPRGAARADRSAGFTLVEVMVTVGLIGLVLAIAVGGWTAYGRSREVKGTAQEIQAALRQAQQQAVSESRSICVLFDTAADSWALYRGACDATDKVATGTTGEAQGRIDLVSPQFSSGASTSAGVTFLPRGTAWPGEVRVERAGDDGGRVVNVEGLTGRVSIN